VFSVSPASLAPSGTLTLSASPEPGTDYIYTTAYYAKGSTWLPVTLTGNNAAPSYSSGPATGSRSQAGSGFRVNRVLFLKPDKTGQNGGSRRGQDYAAPLRSASTRIPHSASSHSGM
jgi:hypothetical protein